MEEQRAREGYRKAELGDWETEVFISLDEYFRSGYAAGNGWLLEQILKRRVRSFQCFAQAHRTLWL